MKKELTPLQEAYSSFISNQEKQNRYFVEAKYLNEAAVKPAPRKPESIAGQRKGAVSAAGVSYDKIKEIKKHFQKHGFNTQSGAKKDGFHRINFTTMGGNKFLEYKGPHANGPDYHGWSEPAKKSATERSTMHKADAKRFTAAVKSSPHKIHHHETDMGNPFDGHRIFLHKDD